MLTKMPPGRTPSKKTHLIEEMRQRLPINLTAPLKRALRYVGVDIRRLNATSTVDTRRNAMLVHHGVEIVIDVGANSGQYATALRKNGYTGTILSFEPLTEAFKTLRENARSDADWKVFNIAIGAEEGEANINVAGNSVSSSLLPMLDSHVRCAPSSAYVSCEHVKVNSLDNILPELLQPGKRVLLKIDTQGYEREVLIGAQSQLQRFDLIECELSLVALYEGQSLYQEIMSLLDRHAFRPVWLEPGFSDETTGYCLQLESIFAAISHHREARCI